MEPVLAELGDLREHFHLYDILYVIKVFDKLRLELKMPRLREIDYEDATGQIKEAYDEVKTEAGAVPNLFKALANSPVTLQAYLTLEKLLGKGKLTETEREIVRLVVSTYNNCDYCRAVHTETAKMNGLSEEKIIDLCQRKFDNPKYAALSAFTWSTLETKGYVKNTCIAKFRDAGYTDENIAEVVALIAQKTLSNYLNHINETEIDFPEAPELAEQIWTI